MIKTITNKELKKVFAERKLTGDCEVCGSRMDTHPKCVYCKILLGKGHESTVDREPATGFLWCWHCTPHFTDRQIKQRLSWRCYL